MTTRYATALKRSTPTVKRSAPATVRQTMIQVTQIDGSVVALNIDRIERVEHNPISRGHGSNVFFVGGGHLVVEESQDTIVGLVLDARARVHSRALASTEDRSGPEDRIRIRPTGAPPLRMVPKPEAGT